MRADKHRFKKVWKSDPDCIAFMKKMCKGRVLNLCSGTTLIGDVNVDLYPQMEGVIEADVLDLDLKEKFDTVVSDPPWNWPYDKRHKFSKTALDHLKPGGRFVLFAPWIPNQAFDPIEIYTPWTLGGFPKNVSLITLSIKRKKISKDQEVIDEQARSEKTYGNNN